MTKIIAGLGLFFISMGAFAFVDTHSYGHIFLCDMEVHIVRNANPADSVLSIMENFKSQGAIVKACSLGNKVVVVAKGVPNPGGTHTEAVILN